MPVPTGRQRLLCGFRLHVISAYITLVNTVWPQRLLSCISSCKLASTDCYCNMIPALNLKAYISRVNPHVVQYHAMVETLKKICFEQISLHLNMAMLKRIGLYTNTVRTPYSPTGFIPCPLFVLQWDVNHNIPEQRQFLIVVSIRSIKTRINEMTFYTRIRQ